MTSYTQLLSEFSDLGGRVELFPRPPTATELQELIKGMRMLREKYPAKWEGC